MLILQAIETKYHGPTNFRGSRHTARTPGGASVRVSCPPELNATACHAYAAQKLAEKMGWTGKWFGGGTKAGYVFVCVPLRFDDADCHAFVIDDAAKAPAKDKEESAK